MVEAADAGILGLRDPAKQRWRFGAHDLQGRAVVQEAKPAQPVG